MILLKMDIRFIWLIIGRWIHHTALGSGSGEWSLISLKYWSLSDSSFAKTLESSCGLRHVLGENPRACSIKMFIDVTHKTLFYYLDWEVGIYLTALLPCFLGIPSRWFFSNRNPRERVLWWVCLPSPPSSCILVLRRWSGPAIHCTFRHRSGERALLECKMLLERWKILEDHFKHSA